MLTLCACEGECSHSDADGDGLCDKCELVLGTRAPEATEEPTEENTEAPATKEVDVTLTVKDQDGDPMAEAVVTILPMDEGAETFTLTADGEGRMTVSLPEGEYTVRFDVLPEYVLGIDTAITVTAGMEPVVLEVMDNTPDGSAEHPFVISGDTLTVTVPAGVTYHFALFGANNRTLTVTDPNAEITYKDTVYTPDGDGKIAVRMSTESPREHSFFALTNKGSVDKEMNVTILSDPGAMDNPIVVESVGETITAQVPQDGMVYYRWTATANGTLTVSSPDTINNISLNNLATSQVSDFTNGGESVSLTVSEGDVITIVVSVLGGDKQAETNPVSFTLTLGE
jgi:hypothetical protein